VASTKSSIQQATPTAENVDIFNESIPANGRMLVLSYATATEPRLTSVATTVTDISVSSDTTANIATVICSGTGAITLTNLGQIRGSSGFYRIINDDVVQGTENSDTYTITGCSTWQFVGVDGSYISGPTNTLLRTGVIVLLAVAIMAAFALPLLTKQDISVALMITLLLVFIIGWIAISFIAAVT